jgi:diphthine synthase
MLYIIGLGLNAKGISVQGMEIAKRCKRVYIETYTVNYPYPFTSVEHVLGKDVEPLNREKVEGMEFLEHARKADVALLVYGSPLMATTHIAILDEAEKSGIKTEVIHAGSVFDGVSETGLQLYKFGKIASMPAWDYEKKFTPDSFMEIIKENQSINAHSLILIDIGLDIQDALNQLEEAAENHKIKLDRLILCQQLGEKKQKIFYKKFSEMKEEFTGVRKPYCLILPGDKLHPMEEEYLKKFS